MTNDRTNLGGTVGAVLAGGHSTRMGVDKATIEFRGRRMIDHVLDALAGVCERTVIVEGALGMLREHLMRKRGQPASELLFIRDVRRQCGPLGGTEALLMSGIGVDYLVCPCDLPRISPELLRMLIRDSVDARATVFHTEGDPAREFQPLPARISAEALPVVRELLDQGQRAVWRLLERLQPRIVTINADQARQLRNVNAPGDLADLEK